MARMEFAEWSVWFDAAASERFVARYVDGVLRWIKF